MSTETTPNFLIAGERRSGTSTLAKWIHHHPSVYICPRFDAAFFVDDDLRGRLDWLDGEIDLTRWARGHDTDSYLKWFRDAKPHQPAVGEKSADYFYWPPCADRIMTRFPQMKILLIFRNPVDRAWSHYWNEVGKGRETLEFEDAIAAEESRIAGSDYARLHLSYFDRGRYVNSLQRWIDRVSEQQLHIVVLEHLIADPLNELKRVYRFLGVDPDLGLELAGKRYNHNWTTIPREFWTKNAALTRIEWGINRMVRTATRIVVRDRYRRLRIGPQLERLTRIPQKQLSMPDHVRRMLVDRYAPSVRQLQEKLNIDLKCWA